MWFGASPAKEPDARAGKTGGGNLNPPPPDKPDNTNFPHNVLVKRVRANQELEYSCMKCGHAFEVPRTKVQGENK